MEFVSFPTTPVRPSLTNQNVNTTMTKQRVTFNENTPFVNKKSLHALMTGNAKTPGVRRKALGDISNGKNLTNYANGYNGGPAVSFQKTTLVNTSKKTVVPKSAQFESVEDIETRSRVYIEREKTPYRPEVERAVEVFRSHASWYANKEPEAWNCDLLTKEFDNIDNNISIDDQENEKPLPIGNVDDLLLF